ncbi:MAG: FtsX-like permease family protein [Myxococcales bacterium FL481]|nr:MAG: FtsX-like permease family protein [Myxococcales bacterium FL481]
MFAFLLLRAWSSLRATPTISALAVLAVALGTALPTAIHMVRVVYSQDPIPHKSDRLFNVRMDSWDPNGQFFDVEPGDPPKHITYRDMEGLLDSPIPEHRTGIATTQAFVYPDSGLRPFSVLLRMCHADFFPLVEAPFAFGSGWTREDDKARRRVTVLSHRMNERLFDGHDSVGQVVKLGDQMFEVVGVLAPFRPVPQYYDVINNQSGVVRDFFLPFDLVLEDTSGFTIQGNTDSWGPHVDSSSSETFFRSSEMTWIQYWVELDPQRRSEYAAFVDAYTEREKTVGRFARDTNNRVTPLMEWMKVRKVVPEGSGALLTISLMFMAVCGLNLSSLLLGKYLTEAHKTGVTRALGATRTQVFVQRIIECQIIGIAGGLIGAGLAQLLVKALAVGFSQHYLDPSLWRVDTGVLLTAVAFSSVAGLWAGVYPAWRAARITPAIQLRI